MYASQAEDGKKKRQKIAFGRHVHLTPDRDQIAEMTPSQKGVTKRHAMKDAVQQTVDLWRGLLTVQS